MFAPKTFMNIVFVLFYLIEQICDSKWRSTLCYKSTERHGVEHPCRKVILYQASVSQKIGLKLILPH